MLKVLIRSILSGRAKGYCYAFFRISPYRQTTINKICA